MVEWLALFISVIAILLEKEKISRLFLDFTGWISRKKFEIEGKQFVKHITSTDRYNSLRFIFTILFFFYLLSSALSGILKVDTIEKLGFISTITLSPLLLLALRGVFRQYKQRQLSFDLL